MADGGVGECTGQAGDCAHLGLQLTAVAGHRELQTLVQSGNVAGLSAGQHGARERPWRRRGWHPNWPPNGWRRRSQREQQEWGR
jgi:hypothetical protein